MATWIPNGKLKDGTMLFGPLNEKPAADFGLCAEGEFNGKPWFVAHSGSLLSAQQAAELKEWAEKVIASRNL